MVAIQFLRLSHQLVAVAVELIELVLDLAVEAAAVVQSTLVALLAVLVQPIRVMLGVVLVLQTI
jgi:hypothetical protein